MTVGLCLDRPSTLASSLLQTFNTRTTFSLAVLYIGRSRQEYLVSPHSRVSTPDLPFAWAGSVF